MSGMVSGMFFSWLMIGAWEKMDRFRSYLFNSAYSIAMFYLLLSLFSPSSSSRAPAASPSTHSISSVTPDRTRFPRGTSTRSTFHGAQLRERRSATYNGPPASPTLSHDTGALVHTRRGTSTGIISKITSKFVRRWVGHTSSRPEAKP